MAGRRIVRPLDYLQERGLLLLQDKNLPSLVGLIVGGPIRGSWWGHAKCAEIFHAQEELDKHPDVMTTKLISGKVTFVHRKLWHELIAIGRAREPWQVAGLTNEARTSLAQVDGESSLRTSGKAAKVLETRLLVASEEVHTESGAHALEFCTWEEFARRAKLRLRDRSVKSSKKRLEDIVGAMNIEYGGGGRLPWPSVS